MIIVHQTQTLSKIKIMKKFLSVIVLLLAVSSVYAQGIDGTWVGSAPNGEMTLTFVFKVTDGKLTGVVKTPNGDSEIINTKIDGKKFSFDVSFNDMTIKHDCVLQEDNTINMKASGTPMGEMAMVLKRQG
jgi:hypothetical protein